MKKQASFISIAVVGMFCMATVISSMVDARGRGGGGFSRGGIAAGGGFSSRAASRQSNFQRDRDLAGRQDRRDERREERQQHREDRRDYLDDEWDDHHDRYYGTGVVTGVAIGAAASSDYVTSEPCSTTKVINGTTYYHCGSTWYTRGYEGDELVYIIVSPPAGYR
jgi:hypothetical protein